MARSQTDPHQETRGRSPFTAIVNEPEAAPAVVPDAAGPLPEKMPELALETVALKFLDAKSLKGVLDSMVTAHGSVAVNETNNSVVICDTPKNLGKMLAEIGKADRTPPQIMVEVVILDVQLRDNTEIGVNWDLLTDDRSNVIYRQNFTSERLTSTMETAETIGDATAFNTVGLGADFSVISGTVRHVLHLVQQKRDVEILASPRALVVSGESATIKAVEEIPYEEIMDTSYGGAAALTSTQFKEVGINLQVTAKVTDGNDIFLTVDTEQNVRTGESARGVPVVDTRRANTSLLLQDGQIVVMGGLRRQETSTQVSQVPVLGNLPLIGNLFKSTSKVVNNSELVVLLSPHIHRGDPVPNGVLAKAAVVREKSLWSSDKEADGDARLSTTDAVEPGGAQEPAVPAAR